MFCESSNSWNDSELCNIFAYAEQYGTPFYFLDADRFVRNIQKFRNAMPPKTKLCYSLKANPWLGRAALKAADYVELCSMGEVHLCIRQELLTKCSERFSIGGVCKTKHDCEFLAKIAPHRISIESISQLDVLSRIAEQQNKTLTVLLRLTSGNQFGMTLDEICEILSHTDVWPNIDFAGVHYYSGTQKRLAKDIQADLKWLYEASKLAPREIEYGPGIGVPLFQGTPRELFNECWDILANGIEELSKRHDVILECGRLLTADVGVYLTRIVDIKENSTKMDLLSTRRKFLIVDGGIHHLNYYGQINGKPHPVILQEGSQKREREIVTVCGALCTTSDILAKDIPLFKTSLGDCLAFMNAGAYSVTEARSLFLSRDLPAVLCQENGALQLLRDHVPTFPLNLA